MEKIMPRLSEFLPSSSELPLKILTVGADYLADLRRRFPNAELYAVVAEDSDEADKAEELCRKFNIKLTFADIYAAPLPFPRNYFDYIVSDLTLEKATNPQDIAAGFGTFIKPTGAWLTSFRNIRHWSVLLDLMEGHYYNVVSRLYAKQEFERLLCASFYKEVRFRPLRRAGDTELIAKLTAAGFSNALEDLDTEFWLVCAAKSMPELALLKSLYDEETRKQLSRILHRIEYGVNVADEAAAFWQLCDRYGIFADYAAAFVEQTVFHRERFYDTLTAHTDDAHADDLRFMLEAAARESLNEEVRSHLNKLIDDMDKQQERK